MTKIGYLLLNDGVWNGNDVISLGWIDKMTTAHPDGPATYGYQISITSDKPIFVAGGAGGQIIYVYHPNNFVIVSTCYAFTIPTDRFNIRCEYGTWKFIVERSLIVSETTSSSTETTWNSASSVVDFSSVLLIPLIYATMRLRRKIYRN